MTGKFLKLLMAASALVPATMMASTATAQQVDQDRGDRGQRPDRGQRQERGDRGPRPDGQPFQQQQRPDRPAAPDQGQRPQRADLGTQPQVRGDRPDGQGRPDWNGQRGGQRGDSQAWNGQRGNGQGWNGQTRPDPRAGQNRPDWNRDQGRPGFDRGNQQADRGQFDRNGGRGDWRNDARNDNRGDNRGDWRNGGRDGYQNRQPNRAYGNVQGYGRGGYNQGRYNQGGAWNRGWRTDNRYAWSNYRASNRGAYRLPRYYAPSGGGSGYRRFGVGFSLNSILYNQNYWIQDPYTYRLPEAYGPYRWVRYYNDALLVDLDSGRVVDTVYDIFW
ncbi:RcnB family protein [Sphingomonas sp. OK281]|uniref:RcnB family protein n=1 Tax=Sphingomonas sp. OK281 TaxID=1881067 RepID=UPI0008F36156|nr:RcnB family protein [Sphingomonas sp. OK281]SFO36538.1 Nickel/cobalt transporter regulator [Sphingomonas sp. OK281]